MIQSFFMSLVAMVWRLLVAAVGVLWSMLRPGLRFIAAVFFVATTVALTIDVTRWQTSTAGPTFKSLENHIRSATPATLDDIAKAVSDATHPLLWDPVITSLLALPAWLALVLAAIGLTYATRERRRVDIFINKRSRRKNGITRSPERVRALPLLLILHFEFRSSLGIFGITSGDPD